MPKAVEKKSKESIAKAATSKKGGAKKWTKGKVKDKVDNAVFLDRATYDRLITSIPKLGKHLSVSGIVEKYKVVGSIARQLLRKCQENGSIANAEQHSRQALYTPVAQVVEKAAAETAKPEAAKKEKAPKKKW